jgi:hypothetical protein
VVPKKQDSHDLFCLSFPPWPHCTASRTHAATQSSLDDLTMDDGAPQYLYIQMEHCEKKTLRDLILSGLSREPVSPCVRACMGWVTLCHRAR